MCTEGPTDRHNYNTLAPPLREARLTSASARYSNILFGLFCITDGASQRKSILLQKREI